MLGVRVPPFSLPPQAPGEGVPSGRDGKAQEMRPGRGGSPGPVTPSRSPRGPGRPGGWGEVRSRPALSPQASSCCSWSGEPAADHPQPGRSTRPSCWTRGACSRPTGEEAPSPLGPPRPAVTESLVADPFSVHSVRQRALTSAGQSRGKEASEERPDRQDPRWSLWFIFGPRRPSRHILEMHGGSGV